MHVIKAVRRSLLAAAGVTIVAGAIGFGAAQGAATGTASGVVYRDANNNGTRDRGEVGVPGVVVQSNNATTVTNASGAWALKVTDKERIQVLTGWYRSQCNSLTCAAGPSPDQDFAVSYQNIVATAVASRNPRLDVGLLPDWPGGYPVPTTRPIPSNPVDVSTRISFVKPTGTVGTSNCLRTNEPLHRACAIGDRPSFVVQVYNEGTTAVTGLAGHLQLPPGTTLVSVVASATPRNHPNLRSLTHQVMDVRTRRVPFAISGSLPPAAMAAYVVTLRVDANAPTATTLQTNGSYPNPVGVRITSVTADAEGDLCASGSLSCPWGTTDRQQAPDNSDTVGFAIVPTRSTPTNVTLAPPTTAAVPTTTTTATTTPPTTTTTTTVPPTTTMVPTTTTTTVPPTTTTTVPPPAPQSPGCTVSELLVPSCGAWFGASTPSADGTYDYARGLTEYEAIAQNTPDILHFYKTGARRFPTAGEIAQAERPGLQRSLLFYNWKPSSTASWAQIASGGADAEIATVAAGLKTYPHTVFLTIFHEPEDNVIPTAGSGMTPDDYAAMYRYVVTSLRAHGVTNVVYVWNVMGYYGWRDYFDALYPGDDYVDWIAYDPYMSGDKQAGFGAMVDNVKPNLGWPGFYSWATAKSPGTPIMLAEWGVDVLTSSDPAGLLSDTVQSMQTRFPMLKALVYWNQHGVGNYRIDDTSPRGVVLGQAYRALAADPYFNATPTAAAP